ACPKAKIVRRVSSSGMMINDSMATSLMWVGGGKYGSGRMTAVGKPSTAAADSTGAGVAVTITALGAGVCGVAVGGSSVGTTSAVLSSATGITVLNSAIEVASM